MSAENIDGNKSQGLKSRLRVEDPILGEWAGLRPVQKLSGGTQGYGEGEIVPKGTPTGSVDLENGDPGGEYNHPEEEAHSWAPDIAFDLALFCVCRYKECLSEEPEDVDQPEKRQESKPTQVVLPAQVQLLLVGHPLQVHSYSGARSS